MKNHLKLSAKYRILTIIAAIFILPVFLLYFSIIPRNYYVGVFVLCVLATLILVYKDHWTLAMLNIRLNNLGPALLPYIVLTSVGVIFLMFISKALNLQTVAVNPYALFFEWSIPIGIAQEFLYRGFLIPKLRHVYSSITTVVLIDAFLFMLLHILYNPPLLILPLTFIAGIAFAHIYIRYPNLLLIALNHAILNFFAIHYGFFLS